MDSAQSAVSSIVNSNNMDANTYIDNVESLYPNKGYKIQDVIKATGWSRSQIYNLMRSAVLPWQQQGAHRRILGKHIKRVFNLV